MVFFRFIDVSSYDIVHPQDLQMYLCVIDCVVKQFIEFGTHNQHNVLYINSHFLHSVTKTINIKNYNYKIINDDITVYY